MSEERVLKKSKTNYCFELCLNTDRTPVLYLLNIENIRYILLDKHWVVIKEYDSYPKNILVRFRIYYDCLNPPDGYGIIQQAKRNLEPKVFDILYQLYIHENIGKWETYAIFGEIPPSIILQEYSILTIDSLMMEYTISEDTQYRDILLHILFVYLKTQSKPLPPHYLKARESTKMARILVWKGYARENSVQRVVFEHLCDKEDEVLFLIALARNRREGNFFAQMDKNILFKKIYPLIRWSLPLDI